MALLKSTLRILSLRCSRFFSADHNPVPLRSKKEKSSRALPEHFVDSHIVAAQGGKGGDGCISFLQLWCNDRAGPDGGDGGNGGHVIFRANNSTHDLGHLKSTVKGNNGENGHGKDCNGKNAEHTFINVPIGTIIKNSNGVIVGDLKENDSMFIAARGGCGGRGNHFFVSDTLQAPEVAEEGATGENFSYYLEIKAMAHFGLVGLPNAGKSTLLRAISRARPEVAAYEFTTLRPYIGVVEFSDYQQIFVADLPGLIEGSHRNEGLGIQFLKHTERCLALLYMIDLSRENPMSQLDILQREISLFSKQLLSRPSIVLGNKIDLVDAQENLELLRAEADLEIIPISAKTGKNLSNLLKIIRKVYDKVLPMMIDFKT